MLFSLHVKSPCDGWRLSALYFYFFSTCGYLQTCCLCHYIIVHCGPWGIGLFPRIIPLPWLILSFSVWLHTETRPSTYLWCVSPMEKTQHLYCLDLNFCTNVSRCHLTNSFRLYYLSNRNLSYKETLHQGLLCQISLVAGDDSIMS